MDKKPVLLYKSLVVGVIVLFIGVGIQPAFAVTLNNSNSEYDCEICINVVEKYQKYQSYIDFRFLK